ncbi:cation transporter, partial [Rhodococcus jostii]|uniref:cation transporter n=1 Tax=Rhodococcus jostii TaxID=132919 RepID=UPI00364FA842
MNRTTVLEVSGVHWASSSATVEAVLRRRPGVTSVEANAVSQTATVTYDPAQTSVVELSKWVRDCGYHCAGRSVPDHVCDPMSEPAVVRGEAEHAHPTPEAAAAAGPTGHQMPAGQAPVGRSPQEMMGHGGGHAGMSMDAMVRDMRNRFLVALVLSVPI